MASEFLVPHRFRAVIWDIDDTLVDTAPSYLIGQREALARLGIPRLQIPHAVALWGHLLPRFGHTDRSTIFHAICIELGHPLPQPAELQEAADSMRLSWQVGVSAKTGAIQCLTLLHDRRVPTGIVSNGDPEPQQIKLAQSGLIDFFTEPSMIFTPTGSPEAKPSPAGLLACATALGVPPQQTCYIGDSATDMIAANLVACRCLVLWCRVGRLASADLPLPSAGQDCHVVAEETAGHLDCGRS